MDVPLAEAYPPPEYVDMIEEPGAARSTLVAP
jgi:hypothetical protein